MKASFTIPTLNDRVFIVKRTAGQMDTYPGPIGIVVDDVAPEQFSIPVQGSSTAVSFFNGALYSIHLPQTTHNLSN